MTSPLPLPLPIREGVAPSYLWLPQGRWPDMLAFLVAHYPQIPAATWRSRMARGEVVDGASTRLTPASPYQAGMRIFYYRELEAETLIPFDEQILFEDEHLLVVDKPHFLPTIPGGRFLHQSLLVRLKKKLGLHDLSPIHRLDRETAGVVIFSKQQASRGAYQLLFQQRSVEKEYEALAPRLAGRTFPFVYRSRMAEGTPFFRMQEVDGEPNSETAIDVIEHLADGARYRLQPRTGRKHQLRVHMAALGIPIINDAFYPLALPCKQDDMSQPLQLLARAVSFVDPFSLELRRFESERVLAGNQAPT